MELSALRIPIPMILLQDEISNVPVDAPAAPMKRRRVLISAIAVSPYHGSEAGIGWNIGTRVAKYHDVTRMSMAGEPYPHRERIEKFFRENGPIPGLTMLYVEPTKLYRFLDRPGGSLLKPFFYFGYASWQRAAYQQV